MNASTITICTVLLVTLNAKSLLAQTTSLELEQELLLPPRVTPQSLIGNVSSDAAHDAIFKRTLPTIADQQGSIQAARKILSDKVQNARATGYFAEEQFLRDNPAWHRVSKPNAPQNDVYTHVQGRFNGGQIKAYANGDPKKYYRAMLEDYKAEHFLIPDDHAVVLRRHLNEHISNLEQRGLWAKAQDARIQLNRVKNLGRTYPELQKGVEGVARTAIAQGAVRVGSTAGLIVVAIDGALVLYDASQGKLSPSEVGHRMAEAAVKGVAVGGATTLAVIAGANPIGLTVILVGGVTYYVVDMGISYLHDSYASSPLSDSDLKLWIASLTTSEGN